MKTTCLALGLLLLAVSHSDAIPLGLESSPGSCCFSFSQIKVPFKKIESIEKTHSGCPVSAFVVKTVEGRAICFNPSMLWVQKVFNRVTGSGIEGSSHP